MKYNNQIDSALVVDNDFEFKGEMINLLEAFLIPANPKLRENMNTLPFMLQNSEILVKLNYSEGEFRGMNMKFLKMDSISGSKSQELKVSFNLEMDNTFYKENNDSIRELILYNNL